MKLLGLNEAFLNWKTMKVISKCDGSLSESLVGRQGKGTMSFLHAGVHVTPTSASASKRDESAHQLVTATMQTAKIMIIMMISLLVPRHNSPPQLTSSSVMVICQYW